MRTFCSTTCPLFNFCCKKKKNVEIGLLLTGAHISGLWNNVSYTVRFIEHAAV